MTALSVGGTRKTFKDVFYVDPSIEGCQSLVSRARKLGFTVRDILEEDVSTCVIRRQDLGTGLPPIAGTEGQSHGRRKERIHRMLAQAQTESGTKDQLASQESTAARATKVNASIMSSSAFRRLLDRAEGESSGRAETARATTRPQLSQVCRRAAVPERSRALKHPRVVIKDLDGLDPVRIQTFTPEMLRRCTLHHDAPTGICPFTPRDQWDREIQRHKKKEGGGVAAGAPDARAAPLASAKPRRGGWCECCQKTYIGTMAEHCAGQSHKAAVENDPCFAKLAKLVGWNGFENRAGGDQSEDHAVPQDTLSKTRDTDPTSENESNLHQERCRTAETPEGIQYGGASANTGVALAKGGDETRVPLCRELDPSVLPQEPPAPVVNMVTGPKAGDTGGNSDVVEAPPVRVVEDGERDEGCKENVHKHPSPVLSRGTRCFDVAGPVVTPSLPQAKAEHQEEKMSRDGTRNDSSRTPCTPRQPLHRESPVLPIVTPSSNGRCHPGGSSACGTELGREEARPIPPPTGDGNLHTPLCGGDAEHGKSLFCLGDGSPPLPPCGVAKGGDVVPLHGDFSREQEQKTLPGAVVITPGGTKEGASAGSPAKVHLTDACVPHPTASVMGPVGPPVPVGDRPDAGLTASQENVGDYGEVFPRPRVSASAEEKVSSVPSCDDHPPKREGSLRKRSRRELNMLADSAGFAEASASSAPSSRRRRGQRTDNSNNERRAARAPEGSGSKRKSKPPRSRSSSSWRDGKPGESRPGPCLARESQTSAEIASSASRPEEDTASSSSSATAGGYACDGDNSSSDVSQGTKGQWLGHPCSVPWTSPSAGLGVMSTREAENGAGISETFEKMAVGTLREGRDTDNEAVEVARNLLVAWQSPLGIQTGRGDDPAYLGGTRPKIHESVEDVRSWASSTAPAGIGATELVVSSGAVLAGCQIFEHRQGVTHGEPALLPY